MEQILALYQSTEHRLSSSIIIDLVKRATSSKKIFGFAELYEPLQERRPTLDLSPEANWWIDILQIFTYGQWKDYKEFLSDSMDESSSPELNKEQVAKLKQLTLLSLCATADIIPYSAVQEQLDLEAEELEPLIIDTIYSGRLTAKLDTAQRVVEVMEVSGRDVDSARIDEICSTLDQWEAKTAEILSSTQRQIEDIKSAKVARALETEDYKQRLSVRQDDKSKAVKRNRS